jgi:hypothetical protein
MFNEIDIRGAGSADVFTKRLTEALQAHAIVFLIQQRGNLPLIFEHFAGYGGAKVVCYPTTMKEPDFPIGTRLLRYTVQELECCNLVAEVYKALDEGIDEYLLEIAA